jgi:phospholipid/cholesterol/gamma-HCH transport system permease protein
LSAVLRFGYEPIRGFIETIGAMMLLFRKTIVAALTPPYDYGPELVDQFLFALRLGWFPMILASLAFTYGPAGIEIGDFLNLLGAIDRLGGLFVIIVMREFAPLVRAIVMAGVAGTAMTADLGARKIREELDALMVLGVDPIKSLVVPRFLSLMMLTPLFTIYALLLGTLGGVLVTLSNGAPSSPTARTCAGRSAACTGPGPRPPNTGTATWTVRSARACAPVSEVQAKL